MKSCINEFSDHICIFKEQMFTKKTIHDSITFPPKHEV